MQRTPEDTKNEQEKGMNEQPFWIHRQTELREKNIQIIINNKAIFTFS